MQDSSLPGRQTERPDADLQSAYDYHLPRRLVVCLDGTWNKRDSGTNVYHISNLVQEGRVKDESGQEWFQVIYYDEGVGTGLLDGVTGGAFGIGLSENVRQAYDWLVEKYREGKPDKRPDDEIYIFGFSRGAFTARSLVGLIAKCGLVYRGAPISPAQLWNAYRILGRHENPKTHSVPSKNWWEQIVGRPKKPFRLIRALKRDAWEPDDAAPKPERAFPRTEKLLVDWSRRVKIHCVGIFDTVGSMGLDALAIPWLRSRLAQFHDTYLTSLIVNGFHALAIDEHRANFVHIPWHDKATSATGKTPAGGTVEQRWFIGAHSNIGGGYDDNMLAAYPLAWMIEKCAALGLEFRTPLTQKADPETTVDPQSYVPLMQGMRGEARMSHQPPQVRDSFADIAKGIWQGLIRSKREYRRIGPPLEYQNNLLASSVNEDVHESATNLVSNEYAHVPTGRRYNPPNLWEYWERTGKMPTPRPSGYGKPKHCYLENWRSWIWLLSWLAGVGAAAAAFAAIARVEEHFWLWPLGAIVVAVLIDFYESALNHSVAMKPDGIRAELGNALLTLAVLLRLIILAGILFGFGYWLVRIWPWLWRHDDAGHLWDLLLLDALLIYFNAAAAWSAAPMLDAGFGSIVDLQLRGKVARVRAWLNQWGIPKETDNNSAPRSNDESKYSADQRRQFLMPVAHTIFRDMFAFIPAYVIVLVLANRMVFSCLAPHVVLGNGFWGTLLQWWQPYYSLAVILGCALADYVEDLTHLRYLNEYPKDPTKVAVKIAFSATLLKMVLFGIASVGLVAGIACMSWDQIVRVCYGQSGGLSVIVLLLTAALLLPPAQATLLGLVRKGETEKD